MPKNSMQLLILAALIVIYAFLAFLVFQLGLYQNLPGQFDFSTLPKIPNWLLGLINGAIIIVIYGSLGMLGYWLAKKSNLTGIIAENSSWKVWLMKPFFIGILLGIFVILVDEALAGTNNWNGFPHPQFPLSLIASATAGIGEEILYRAFFLSLSAFLLFRLLSDKISRYAILCMANIIAALVFAAAHIPAAMVLLKVQSISALPAAAIIEIFVINGVVGLFAGDQYIKQGLVAAVGVHFWADIIWHVLYPSLF